MIKWVNNLFKVLQVATGFNKVRIQQIVFQQLLYKSSSQFTIICQKYAVIKILAFVSSHSSH